MLFQRNRDLTSPAATKLELRKAYRVSTSSSQARTSSRSDSSYRQWLDVFKQAHDGDAKLQRVLQRYGSMIAAKREKEKWKQLIRNQLVSKRLQQNPKSPLVPPCPYMHLTALRFSISDGGKHDAASSYPDGYDPKGDSLQQAASEDESPTHPRQYDDQKTDPGAFTASGAVLGFGQPHEAYRSRGNFRKNTRGKRCEVRTEV